MLRRQDTLYKTFIICHPPYPKFRTFGIDSKEKWLAFTYNFIIYLAVRSPQSYEKILPLPSIFFRRYLKHMASKSNRWVAGRRMNGITQRKKECWKSLFYWTGRSIACSWVSISYSSCRWRPIESAAASKVHAWWASCRGCSHAKLSSLCLGPSMEKNSLHNSYEHTQKMHARTKYESRKLITLW